MEMSREGVAGGPGGPVPDRRWMEMSASISSTGYRVACTVSASYGQGLGEAGQIRGADRGTSAVPGRCPGIRWPVRFEFVRLYPRSLVPGCRWHVQFEFVPGSPGQGKSDFVPGPRVKLHVPGLVTRWETLQLVSPPCL